MIGVPAFFLDRDGTLIEERQYVGRTEDVEILPSAFEAVRQINRAGFPAVVVTNQSGVARGYFTEVEVRRINDFLRQAFQNQGAVLDHFYYCPHHPQAEVPAYRTVCHCRKPEPGMLLRAARDLELDLTRSVILGDTLRDVEAGHRAGCRGVLVQTGYGTQQDALLGSEGGWAGAPPEHVARDVLDGVLWALENGFEAAPE